MPRIAFAGFGVESFTRTTSVHMDAINKIAVNESCLRSWDLDTGKLMGSDLVS